MKTILFLLLLGLINNAYSQDLEVSVLPINKNSGTSSNLFKLKLLNNSKHPVGIICSWSFLKHTEKDTLSLGIGEWYNGDGVNYYYGINGSVRDGHTSAPTPMHLIILSPQNYLSTNIKLTDLENYYGKTIYYQVGYTSELSSEEIIKYSDKSHWYFGSFDKNFKTRDILLYDSYGNSDQSKSLSISDSCSAIMKQNSYFWIKDSLANNGFRACNFQDFLKCKIDDLTPEYLMLKLGKPNKIRETNHGTQYEYYYFDDRALPENEASRPGACGYILFAFSKENKFIEVVEGVIDY